MEQTQRTKESYTIAWICALPIEQAAAQGMLDERHPNLLAAKDDTNSYRFGSIGKHDVVIAVMKSGGTAPAATAATNLLRSFPNIRFGLMVGVGGGAPGKPYKNPQKDIRLGDVVVSHPTGEYGGVVQYDVGKSLEEEKFIYTGSLNSPPAILSTAVAGLRGDALLHGYEIQSLVDKLVTEYPKAAFQYPGDDLDKLFVSDYTHIRDGEASEDDCMLCEDTGVLQREQRLDSKEPAVHYGLIGSANQVLRSSKLRNKLREELGILCFEMEAGGLMNDFPCLVVRGVCDYSDSHKNKQWQPYAAATAAAYTKQLLSVIAPETVTEEKLVREVINTLETQTLVLDQLKNSTDMVETKLDLKGLPTVPNAAFDSHVDYDEQDSTCLIGTRLDILQNIRDWVSNTTSRSIFWLNGMAGTGKSTIARSVAQEFAQRRELGASFFFKRGEGDRQSCKYLFTTIAGQLAQYLPLLRPSIISAVRANPDIGYKAFKEQFDRLVLLPLKAIASQLRSPVVLVIDALDECVEEDKVHIIIGLLSQLRSDELQNVRILLTSRREQILDESFKELTTDVFEDIVLHEITETTIEQDISRYLDYRFDQLRTKNPYKLSTDWPGHKILESLTALSSPLFIFAATICRFVEDRRSDPAKRLQSVLESKKLGLNKLQQTYQVILETLLDVSDPGKEDIRQDFVRIVGTIVVLVEPLAVFGLAELSNTEHTRVNTLLRQLQSVLRVSTSLDTPIRTLHASFSDYLLRPQQRHNFCIDASEVHCQIALRCLDILQNSDCLSKGDICNLKDPGFVRTKAEWATIKEKLPDHVRYACRYWVHHLKKSSCLMSVVEDQIHTFFRKRFLFWFEALILLGKISEAILALSDLSILLAESTSSALKAAVYDAKRFAMANGYVANTAPLQLYSSCIIFSPLESIVRANFAIPPWLQRLPEIQRRQDGVLRSRDEYNAWLNNLPVGWQRWDNLLQNLEGHNARITSLAYSPDGNLLASGSRDGAVKLWDTNSGQLNQTFEHIHDVTSVAFSPNGKLLASGSSCGTINLWHVSLGQLQQTIAPCPGSIAVTSMAFSPDDKLLAFIGERSCIKLWNLHLGELCQNLNNQPHKVISVAFSPTNSKLLVSGSDDHIIRLWNIASARVEQIIKHTDRVTSVAFSPDGTLLASGTANGTITTWNIASGEMKHNIRYSDAVYKITFSPNGKLLASSIGGTIKLFDVTLQQLLLRQTYYAGNISPNPVGRWPSPIAFGSDSITLASCVWSHGGQLIQLWDTSLVETDLEPSHEETDLEPSHEETDAIGSLIFSPNGKLLAAVSSSDGTIKLSPYLIE